MSAAAIVLRKQFLFQGYRKLFLFRYLRFEIDFEEVGCTSYGPTKNNRDSNGNDR
jgi:hypothetical protein